MTPPDDRPAANLTKAEARVERRQAVRAAADRVARLSRPGTPERLFTLIEVAEETGVCSAEIVTELIGRKVPR